jgi:hypothetical protein
MGAGALAVHGRLVDAFDEHALPDGRDVHDLEFGFTEQRSLPSSARSSSWRGTDDTSGLPERAHEHGHVFLLG